ncbi:hypothetical protein LAUMK13_05568 [Mycobacterium innocens]|uniref:Uncharacterized protein n=1 Tax=Mycobacterium innocens TaxID=2341083 RepID=A0A498QIU5_9MYCO|nr:hypothetical protein LAUMK13_05568 [Mycobacterium innocens]
MIRECGSVVFARRGRARRAVSVLGFGPVSLWPCSASLRARSAIRVWKSCAFCDSSSSRAALIRDRRSRPPAHPGGNRLS